MGTFLKKMIMNCDEEKVNMTPLTFTAEEANSSVKLTKFGSPTVDGVQYRIGTSGGWSPYTIDTEITLTNVGDCVQFQNTLETLGTDSSNYVQFVMTGKIAASGNCMSMLNFSDKMTAYAFYYLFDGCTSLVNAPELPATVLVDYCYQNMFNECTKLNYIKVNFSSWVDNTTNNWVAGVSSTGVFNAPSDLPVIVGDSNVPTGWTVTNN